MMDRNCPCTKDCPNRGRYCTKCEPFKKYREERQKEYVERTKETQIKIYMRETSRRLKRRGHVK